MHTSRSKKLLPWLGIVVGGFTSTAGMLAQPTLANPLPAFYGVEDFNQDGIPDLVTVSAEGAFTIAIGHPDGSFEQGDSLMSPYRPLGGAIGRINPDSWPDVILWHENRGEHEIVVVFGNDHNSLDLASTQVTPLTIREPVPVGSRPVIALTSLDQDAFPDLVIHYSGRACGRNSSPTLAYELDTTGSAQPLEGAVISQAEHTYSEALVMAASYETRLSEALKNPHFATELYLLGLSYAALEIPPTAALTEAEAEAGFLWTLWQTDPCDISSWQEIGRSIYEFVQPVSDQPRLFRFSRYLIDAAKLAENADERDPAFIDSLLGLGQVYASIDPISSPGEEAEHGFFLGTLWEASDWDVND